MSDSNIRPRKKLNVIPEVQGKLLVRLAVHWCFYMAAILLVVSLWSAYNHPEELALKMLAKSFVYFAPAILASIILLPLFAFDYLRHSHKLLGPLVRLESELNKLAAGEDVEELNICDSDHWDDLAANYNRVAKMAMAGRRAMESTASEETTNERELVSVD